MNSEIEQNDRNTSHGICCTAAEKVKLETRARTNWLAHRPHLNRSGVYSSEHLDRRRGAAMHMGWVVRGEYTVRERRSSIMERDIWVYSSMLREWIVNSIDYQVNISKQCY